MKSIDNLNAEYVKNIKKSSVLETCIKEMNSLKSRAGNISTFDCLTGIVKSAESTIYFFEQDNSRIFLDLLALTKCGLNCLRSISDYKNASTSATIFI